MIIVVEIVNTQSYKIRERTILDWKQMANGNFMGLE